MLTDDQNDPAAWPTNANMRMHMQRLVTGAQAGDSLIFHYSGACVAPTVLHPHVLCWCHRAQHAHRSCKTPVNLCWNPVTGSTCKPSLCSAAGFARHLCVL